MSGGPEDGESSRYGRAAGLLSIGVGATGLVTYLYFALASHNLGPTDYGELAVLWSAVFITVSVLYRPVEQLLSRSIAEHEAHGLPTAHPIRVAATIQAALAIALAVVALALKGPITDDLLSGNETLYWIFLGATLGYAASYFARGYLAGSRRFSLYAGLMLCESLSRTAFALAVALGIADGQTAVALGILAAPLLSLSVVPFAILHRVRRDAGEAGAGERSSMTLSSGAGFATAVLAIMVCEQTFLNAGPLILNASLGAAAAGFIFNVLMIARAPLQLFQAVATSLLPHLTRLRASGTDSAEQEFKHSVRATIRAIAALTGLVVVVMAIAGPDLMEIAFGGNFSYDREGLLIVTAGAGLYLSAATLNQAALAQAQAHRAAACWIVTTVGFLVLNLLPVLDEFRRVEVAFTLAAAVLCALLYRIYRNPKPREADEIAPGSVAELEAQMAAADEAG